MIAGSSPGTSEIASVTSRAGAQADKAALADWCVAQAHRAILLVQAQGGVEVAPAHANALAHHKDARVARHLLGLLAPSAAASTVDPDEQLRQKIASIPIAKLRDSGLLGAILQLTEVSQETRVEESTIDEMSVDDLINLAHALDDIERQVPHP